MCPEGPPEIGACFQDRTAGDDRRPTGSPAQAQRLSLLAMLLVTPHEIRQFRESELAQLHDRGLAAIDWRQGIACLVPAVRLHDDPCFVHAVIAAEISVRQEM